MAAASKIKVAINGFGTIGKRVASAVMLQPDMELVRLAIPRRVYTQSHIDYVIEACAEVYERRDQLVGLQMTNDPPSLRHFTARFEEL